MNRGSTVPPAGADPEPTTRQWITDLNAKILADAYGYDVVLPSDLYSDESPVGQPQALPLNALSFGTSHLVLDAQGTLLVQGLSQDPTDTASTVDDTITLDFIDGGNNDPSDDLLRIELAYTIDGDARTITRRVHANRVERLLIAGNGGTDTVNATSAFETAFGVLVSGDNRLVQAIDYVVSSNEDALEAFGQSTSDGVIDLDSVVPGTQVTLRAAVQEVNAGTGQQAIYLAPNPGNYELTLTGGESSNASANDLDITGDVTIVGAGAGLSVIDASGLGDRIFDVRAGGELSVQGVTLTGGTADGGDNNGGAIAVRNGGELSVDEVAFFGNTAGGGNGLGGAIYFDATAGGDVRNSVITANHADNFTGGIFAQSGSTIPITLTANAIAKNTDGNPTALEDLIASSGRVFESGGYNLIGLGSLDGTGGSQLDGLEYNVRGDRRGDPTRIVTTLVDQTSGEGLAVREAVAEANSLGGTTWVPAWRFRLTEKSSGAFAVSGSVELTGAGAGRTVLDAGGAAGLDDRLFDVKSGGELELSRMTLTGGRVTSPVNNDNDGGAIVVRDNGWLGISESALVDNDASDTEGIGGAIYFHQFATGFIERSVVAGNRAGKYSGGVFATNGPQSHAIEIASSIIGDNQASSVADLVAASSRVFVTGGNNLIDQGSVATGDGFVYGSFGDVRATPDLIVTTTVDKSDGVGDPTRISLRDAVIDANGTTGDQTIWLPAWEHLLTETGSEGPNDA